MLIQLRTIWPGLLVVLLFAAYWPSLDLPGRAAREALLIAGSPLVIVAAVMGRTTRVRRSVLVLFAIASTAGLLGIAGMPPAERFAATRDLAVLCIPWMFALAGSMAGGSIDASRGQHASIETGAALAIAGAGVLGLCQAWLGLDLLVQTQSPGATFVNRNVAAQAIAPLLPLVIVGLFRGDSAWRRWLSACSFGIAGAFVVATRSRGAWIAIAVALAWVAAGWAVRMRRHPTEQRPTWTPAIVCFGILATAFVVPNSAPAPTWGVSESIRSLATIEDGSPAVRVALWRNTWVMIADHPWLGVGAGRYAVEYPRYQAARVSTPTFTLEQQPEHPHADPLEYAAELGIPATAALYAVLLWAIVHAWRGCIRTSSRVVAARLVGLMGALVTIVVHGLVSFPLHSPTSAVAGWLLAGLALGYAGEAAPRPRRQGLLLALGAVLTLPLTVVAVLEIGSQRSIWLGTHAVNAGRCPEALAQTERQRRLAPWKRRDVGLAAMFAFFCDDDPGRSLETIERALALQPDQPNLLLAAGHKHLQSGRVDRAETLFRRVSEIDRRIVQARLGLAMVFDTRGDRCAASRLCAELQTTVLTAAHSFCERRGYPDPSLSCPDVE